MIRVKRTIRVENLILEDGDLIKLVESKKRFENLPHYKEYLEYCEATHDGEILYEGKISDALLGIVEFIKKIGTFVKYKATDLFKLFKDKNVFAFFSELKWDYDSFLKLVSAGTRFASTVLNPLGALINILFPDLASKAIGKLSDTELSKVISKNMVKINKWVKEHKSVLVATGVAFAGLYLVIWLTMNNTGDLSYDFDISDLLNAFTGRMTLIDFISSEDGIKQLILFFLAVGGVGNSNLLANLVGSTAQLVLSVIRLFAEQVKVKLSSGKNTDKDYEDLLGAKA